MKNDNMPERIALMLAFQTVITHGKKSVSGEEKQKIIELARHINEFCGTNFNKAFSPESISFAEDSQSAKIDAMITMYLDELRKNETTQLPEDRETLIQLYDRLQQRKSRRMQWQFYATAKEEKLADLILSLLDEEIEDAGVQS